MQFLGVDTGGTFTDFVYYNGQQLRIHKVMSTPDAPERAILQGIKELGLEYQGLQLIHGSTVATNALLERKEVKTAYITNQGLADILTIGRQARTELYNLTPKPPAPPVARDLCFEINTRMSAGGENIKPVKEDELQALAAHLQTLDIKAVAINLLFAFTNNIQEQQIAAAMPQNLFVSCSSDVLPEYREYERGIATWINASLSPLMQNYLQNLSKSLAPANITVMQSTGGTTTAKQAGQFAVHLLLSGPAGGLSGAHAIGRLTGTDKMLTFDMGGTSTDAALIEGELKLTRNTQIGHYPVAVPMVDMHTIGAGGGSIASIDAGGLLKIGPESAGAKPGPACYGLGGTQATVTDANVVLGRLPAIAALGGHLKLDLLAARQAVGKLAAAMRLGIEQAAEGIIALCNEHMSQALRVISVQRGIDIKHHTLVSFGGAGGLHVCQLAEQLNMSRALVPAYGGVLSALGMVAAPQQRLLSKTVNEVLGQTADTGINEIYEQLLNRALNDISQQGIAADCLQSQCSADLRYQGQSYTLEVPWAKRHQDAGKAFELEHKQRYGHNMNVPIELVNVRVNIKGPARTISFPKLASKPGPAVLNTRVFGHTDPVPCYQRAELHPGQSLSGPAIVLEPAATTFIDKHWRAKADSFGNLLLLAENNSSVTL